MSREPERPSVRFEPLSTASRGRLIAAFVVGPVLWLAGLIAAAWLSDQSSAIAFALLVTVAAFLVSLVVLAFLHAGRRRRERRCVDHG